MLLSTCVGTISVMINWFIRFCLPQVDHAGRQVVFIWRYESGSLRVERSSRVRSSSTHLDFGTLMQYYILSIQLLFSSYPFLAGFCRDGTRPPHLAFMCAFKWWFGCMGRLWPRRHTGVFDILLCLVTWCVGVPPTPCHLKQFFLSFFFVLCKMSFPESSWPGWTPR